jgi:anaerobic ribonucleoside-triphosphate reductase
MEIDKYLNKEAYELKENSNIAYSLQALNLYLAGKEVKKYWLGLYGGEIAKAHDDGYFHAHDLTGLSNYCGGYSMEDVLYHGFGVDSQSKSKPPKHLSSALGQLVNFLFSLSQEIAGAVAVSSFDTLLAPFIKEDALSYEETKQQVQEFVFNMNVATRVGGQRVFSNLTIDLVAPNKYKTKKVLIGGQKKDYCYGDCQKEMNMINKALAEVMIAGDAHGKVFSFPIITVNLTKDFDWNNFKELWELTGKYGAYTFANYINSDMDPEDAKSLCCFFGLQNVIVKHNNMVRFATMRELCVWSEFEVLQKGKWVKAKPVKVPYAHEFYKIKLRNGVELTTTEDHLNYTERGILRTDDLVVGDTIPFNYDKIDKPGYGSYEIGKLIGLYIAEGSQASRQSLQFSIGSHETEMAEFILSNVNKYFCGGGGISQNTGDSITVFTHCPSFKALINKFVSGKGTNKNLINVDKLNTDCLQGIWDGWIWGDGKQTCGLYNKEYYTCSKKLAQTMVLVGRILGYAISLNTRTRDTQYKKNSILYSLRICNTEHGRIYKNGMVEIVSIQKTQNRNKVAFCVEVLDDEEPMFEIENGCITHNCRLRLNTDEIPVRRGGLFGIEASTGSIGVCTISLPMLAMESGGCKEKFIVLLNYYTNLAKSSLEIKRRVIEDLTEKGLYPYNKQVLQTIKDEAGGYWSNHFSTIGIIGGNEACINMFGKGIEDPDSKDWIVEIMNYLRDKMIAFKAETGHLYNLEASPGESSGYSLAQKALKKYPGCAVQGEKDGAYFTNSTHLPVDHTGDIFEILEHQEDLQKLYTGGTTINFWLGQSITGDQAKMLVKKIAENYSIPYFTLSPTFSSCVVDGFIEGEHAICPKCGGQTEIFTRIVGYFSATSLWNKGKTEEFKQRKTYTIETT